MDMNPYAGIGAFALVLFFLKFLYNRWPRSATISIFQQFSLFLGSVGGILYILTTASTADKNNENIINKLLLFINKCVDNNPVNQIVFFLSGVILIYLIICGFINIVNYFIYGKHSSTPFIFSSNNFSNYLLKERQEKADKEYNLNELLNKIEINTSDTHKFEYAKKYSEAISKFLDPRKDGFHLCISTDEWMLTREHIYTLLFQQEQTKWAKRYRSDTEDAQYFIDTSDKRDESSIACINNIIEKSIQKCLYNINNSWETLLEKFDTNKMIDEVDKSSINHHLNIPESKEQVKVRSIRLVFFNTQNIADILYDEYRQMGGLDKIFNGPYYNGTYNLWIPSTVKMQMDVEKWLKGNYGEKPPLDGGGFSLGALRLWRKCNALIENKNSKKFFNQFNCDYKGELDKVILQREIKTSGFKKFIRKRDFSQGTINLSPMLSICGLHTIIGSDPVVINDKKEDLYYFIESLPIFLMAMHCKKIILFDWLYKFIHTSNVSQNKNKFEKALNEWLNE